LLLNVCVLHHVMKPALTLRWKGSREGRARDVARRRTGSHTYTAMYAPPAADVAWESRPLSRERPAPASRGQDAHATAGGTPTLREPGYRVTYLPVDREGLLHLADLEAAITDETAVVSLMWANNETGVLFPGRADCGNLPRSRRTVPLRRGAGGRQGPG